MHIIHHYDELCSVGERLELPKGVCLQDMVPPGENCVFLLDEGVCAATKMTESGGERTFTYFTPRWLFSIVPLYLQEYADEEWEVQYYTRTPCSLYRIAADQFDAMVEQYPLLAKTVMKVLSYNLVRIQSNFFDREDLPAFLRVCKVLLQLDTGEGIAPFFTAEELGSFIGAHSVTVAKIIVQLKKHGFVGRRNRRLFVDDRSGLTRVLKERIILNYYQNPDES